MKSFVRCNPIKARIARTLLCVLCLVLFLPSATFADALVINRAASASTIAEFFIEPESVLLRLEIGAGDINAFSNILPDAVYERLGNAPLPLAERIDEFFTRDMLLRSDGGSPMSGTITSMEARPRILRDPITGEPLTRNDDDSEMVIQAEISYPLKSLPKMITFSPVSKGDNRIHTNIGFVVYHMGLPVNDFRYLSAPESLDLDWTDPWYSSFQNRNLKRRYVDPISTFIYAEHYEVRKEIIVRPKDLQYWTNLGLENKTIIPSNRFEEVKDLVANFLIERAPVLIDGQTIQPKLDSVHFIRRTMRQTSILDVPEDLDINSATLGVIISYPVNTLPDEITMEWDLFNERIQKIYASTTDEAGGLPYALTPDDRVLVWTNFLTNPTIPKMISVANPVTKRIIRVSIVSIGALALLILSLLTMILSRKHIRMHVTIEIVAIAVILAGWPLAKYDLPLPGMRPAAVANEQATEILHGLLYNVYRAFDRNDEEYIYDNLALSIHGDMLSDVYLQTRKSMVLENQGGIKIKVQDVSIESMDVTDVTDDGGFSAQVQWTASGSVGHWGHLHQRTNLYRALFTVTPVEGSWKITYMELQEEIRVDPAQVI